MPFCFHVFKVVKIVEATEDIYAMIYQCVKCATRKSRTIELWKPK
jgi:hypothetical protein